MLRAMAWLGQYKLAILDMEAVATKLVRGMAATVHGEMPLHESGEGNDLGRHRWSPLRYVDIC